MAFTRSPFEGPKRTMMLRALLSLLFAAGCAAPGADAASRPPSEYQVGAYYFAGWWSTPVPSNYLTNHTTDWRPQYPEREPVFGWFDDTQAAVDQEIALAADGGLDFFVFDYYAEVGPGNPGAAENANNGLKYYLTSPNKSRLRFAVVYVNHSFSPTANWDANVAAWIDLMRDPQYVSIAGRPILIVIRPDLLRTAWGSAAAARAALDRLRAQAIAAGLPSPLIGGGAVYEAGAYASTSAADGYDFLTTYALDVDDTTIFPSVPTDYSDMTRTQTELWRGLAAASPLPYVPSALAGWDARPIPEGTNWITGQTSDGLRALIVAERDAIDHHANFRLPARDGSIGVALVYAWNELSEGGYIVPTLAQGDAYLRSVTGVFR